MNILMYMLMGDPAMPIWTGGLPCAANVGYPAVIQCGPCSVTVQVN
jgi:hypothetical protein